MQSILALIMIACLMFMKESNERSQSQIRERFGTVSDTRIRRILEEKLYILSMCLRRRCLYGGFWEEGGGGFFSLSYSASSLFFSCYSM